MTTTQVKTGTTGIQTPTGDNVQTVLKQLKEVVEVGQRLRGDPLNSFVRVSDLVNNNMARLVNGQLKPPSTTGSSGGGGGSGTVTSITAGTGLSGGTITVSGTIALASTAVAAGSYTNTNLTVNAQGQITAASNGSAGNATPAIDTVPASPTAWDDEFTYGTALDTSGARRAGANAWSYLSSNSSPAPTVASSWMRVNGSTTTIFCAKQAIPSSGAWAFTAKVIGPYASASQYGIGLAILNNAISTNNSFQIMGYDNLLYIQENSYNPSTGALAYVSNVTSISFTTNQWYYLCIYYPGTGTTYYFYYSTLNTQLTNPGLVAIPTEYATTGPPAGFSLLTSVSLGSASHIALLEVSTADVQYCDWFRRTL